MTPSARNSSATSAAGVDELVVGALLKLLHAHVRDPIGEKLGRHTGDADHLAHQIEHDGFGRARPPDPELDVPAGSPAQVFDEPIERLRRGVPAVDADDGVAASDARALGRGTLDGSEHDELIVARLDLDADPSELAFGVVLERLEIVGRHVARVGVELGHHPLDRPGDELRPVDGVDVLVFDLDEHASKLLDRGVGCVASRGVGSAPDRAGARTAGERGEGAERDEGDVKSSEAQHRYA
jgi:hypothetical protein